MAKKPKKIKPREKRELKKQLKNQERAQTAAEKAESKTPVKTEVNAEPAKAGSSAKIKHDKKSAAKAIGLKSGFVVGDDLILTSFGKGNTANPEKKISGDDIKKLGDGAFEVKDRDESTLTLESGRIKNMTAKPKDPRHFKNDNGGTAVKFKEDLLGVRKKLETDIFGATFDDNIHVQLAYNILDIEKIMAQYINDIIYLLHNVTKEDMDDFIGYMSIRNTYNTFCNPDSLGKYAANVAKQKAVFERMTKCGRLFYFGNAFAVEGKDGKPERRAEEQIYHIITLLGSLRQSYFHGEEKDQDHQGPTWAYTLESKLTGKQKEFADTLDRLYAEGIGRINSNFGSTNKVPLQSLEFLLGQLKEKVEPKELAADYYDFIIRKKYKYLGFSIKTIRETMLENTSMKEYKDDKYNSVRSKLYKLIDYLIYDRYYHSEPDRILKVVNALRVSRTEEEKNAVYVKEAEYVYDRLGSILGEPLKEQVDGKTIKNYQESYNAKTANKRWDVSDCTISEDTNYFCKLIYMMTLMLDGKEINDLLTTLVNKFDNIASFIDVMDKLEIEHDFTPEYKMFADSQKICEDLKLINSFARMSAIDANSKNELCRDALVLLGIDKDKADIDKFLDEEFYKPNKNGKHDFRNFIINNVVKSSRFKYMVRYSSADGMIKLKSNEKLISFVLKQLPETQIDRYYESCKLDTAFIDKKYRINKLAELIRNMNFDDFKGVRNSNKATFAEKQNKAKYQAIISLYLMVLYQIVKNMIYVNSRYVIAFHCLERDFILKGIKFDSRDYKDCRELTKRYIDNDRTHNGKQDKVGRYLENNINCCSNEVIKVYRNQVDHFAMVRMIGKYAADIKEVDSWFGLYHYVMQRIVFDMVKSNSRINLNSTEKKYKECISKHHSYCKDMVKALNTPFGYNLVRYKNLSIGDLFDRNNYLNKTKESIEIKNSVDNPG